MTGHRELHRIHIDIDAAADGTLREVRVGGQAVLVAR